MTDDNPRSHIFRLVRRRESVTADEVVAKMNEVPWPEHAKTFSAAVILMIELTITEICNPGEIEEKPDGRTI